MLYEVILGGQQPTMVIGGTPRATEDVAIIIARLKQQATKEHRATHTMATPRAKMYVATINTQLAHKETWPYVTVTVT